MSDDRLRDAERRWSASHALEDEVDLVQERLRAGLLEPLRVKLAAELGSAAAARVTGVAPVAWQHPEELLEWGARSHRFGAEAGSRMVLADMHRLLIGCAREAELAERFPEPPGATESRRGWIRVARGWADLLEARILGGMSQAELLACLNRRLGQELWQAQDEAPWGGMLLFGELPLAVSHAIHALERGDTPTVWAYGSDFVPRYRWPGEPAASVWSSVARELIPWGLGHHDPLRRRLEELRVASPCSADWEAMQGDERARFCDECQQTVWDLSQLTWPEARALVANREGRLCVRFYRRADGTFLTRDCPDWVRSRPRPEDHLLMGDVAG